MAGGTTLASLPEEVLLKIGCLADIDFDPRFCTEQGQMWGALEPLTGSPNAMYLHGE